MDQRIFNRFKSLIYANSGIALNEGKEALVSARVGKRMRALGIPGFHEYLSYVEHDSSEEEIVQLLDAISTNVTSFFREPAHFNFVREKTAEWLARGQRRMRFWSAACSTGEEPYSLAITLQDTLGAAADVKILATDICTRVLKHSMRGVYDPEKLRTVAPQARERYFHRIRQEGQTPAYAVDDALKNMIVFRRLNLAKPPYPMRGPLDIIFCRNVMIYFDNKVRAGFLAEAWRLLKPGGYLLVGHAESLAGMMSDFKAVMPAVYAKC